MEEVNLTNILNISKLVFFVVTLYLIYKVITWTLPKIWYVVSLKWLFDSIDWALSKIWYIVSFKWLFGSQKSIKSKGKSKSIGTKLLKGVAVAKAAQVAHNLTNPPVVYVTNVGAGNVEAKVHGCTPKGSGYEVHYSYLREGFLQPSQGKHKITRITSGFHSHGVSFKVDWPK